MATNVRGMAFNQMNQEETDCIKSSIQGVTWDQEKVTGHPNIYESNIPDINQENLRASKGELPIDICITQRAAENDF